MPHNHYQNFLNLHSKKKPLILYNCWNASTAKILELNKQEVIATSSYAIADSLGYEDGEHLPFEILLLLIENIITKINIPLTVDMESGYGDNYLENILDMVELGVTGINIEDRIIGSTDYELVPTDKQSHKIESIVKVCNKKNYNLFINARTDIFFKYNNHDIAICDMAIKRAIEYKKAGANCIFIPGLTDIELIKYFVKHSPLPVNVMISDSSPSVEELSKAGVNRISYGPTSYFNAQNDFQMRIKKED